MKKTIILPIFCLFAIVSITQSCQDHKLDPNDPSMVRVVGLTEQIDGKSYSDLDEAASKFIFPADFSQSPLDDEDGSRSAATLQPLPNFMILGSNLGGTSTRSLTIPAGRYVYMPIVGFTNYYFANDPCYPNDQPAPGQSLADYLESFAEPLNTVQNLTAQLDGKDLVPDLKKYKVKTRAFSYILPKDILDPNCDYSGQTPTVLDVSYALLLKIPTGKHVLTYKADLPDAGNFHTEMIWNLTVE